MRTVVIVFLTAALAMAFENHEAKEDAAALQVDGFFGLPGQLDSVSGDVPFSRAYGYSFFPIMKVAEKDLVGSAEFSIMPRTFQSQGSDLNGPILQSYGLGLGYQAFHTPGQEGFAYGMVGINGDMRDLGPENIYGDLSYTHQFNVSKRLMIGGGIDFHFYFGDYFPYPVILLDWRIADHTKVKIDFDTGELKQFLTDCLSVSLGAQYDIFHYGFGRREGYVQETIDGMLRLEYRISENVYGRVSAKKPVWGGEKVWTRTGTGLDGSGNEGGSIRMQIAYGI
ncbi:MAG: hypothetical protein JWO30_3388 [Fibrobacteres bacterium]|nr:hypothetical protein [Fibrobacterota bacterium]